METIILPVRIFLFIGLDYFNDANNRFKNHCKLVLFIIMLFTFFIGQIIFFTNIEEVGAGFLDLANAIPCLFLILQNIFKLTVIRKKHLIKDLILEIAELWPQEFQSKEKENVFYDSLRRLKKFRDAILKLTCFGVMIYMCLPIFIYFIWSCIDGDTPYLYPFQLYYFVKINSLWKYQVFYLMQIVSGTMIHICMYWSCDLLLVTLTSDICILLRLLQYDLQNIIVQCGRESLDDLKRIVKTHQKLLRLADKLNEIFGGIMLNITAVSSVVICFFGFLTIVVEGKFQKFKNLATVLQCLFIVFYIMLPGQILSDTSSGIADAAYQSMWYNSDPKFKKIIFIIIARSQKPCKLRAMSYGNMDFNAFCKICSTAWSYLSLVNQMYQKGGFEV
uniref:Odorant receptor n=1 Tax=Lobesia botrana TaxID=209534 RepID=A0A345BEY3_9NEOP|nr:odorant receptors OR68 [Lobesia botrana]